MATTSDPILGLSRSQVRRIATLDGVDTPEWPEAARCPHVCTADPCDLEPWQCHERHAGPAWIYSPEACERKRTRG